MTSTSAATHDLAPLRSSVSGPVFAPGEDGWDAARQAWNVLADQRPAGVVFAQSADDVAACVEFARTHGLRVAPRAPATRPRPSSHSTTRCCSRPCAWAT